MKKYLNKGLFYQWFNSAKAVIFLGLVAWGYMSYEMIERQFFQVKCNIVNTFDNYIETFSLDEYVGLGVIFIIIHLAGQGLSKRNNLMFLNSSPYTKKQIKYNEIICLMITELLFIAVFIYMAAIRYFNYRNLLSIVDGYFAMVCIEVVKIILIGIIGIVFIMIIDSMFSNSIVGFIFMISAIPLSIVMIFAKIKMTSEYVPVKDGKNIYQIQFMKHSSEEVYHRLIPTPLFDSTSIREIHLTDILVNIAIVLVITAILFIVYNKIQKLNTLEYSTKIFSSKINEKIIRILCSIGAGCFASLMIVSSYIDKLQGRNMIRYHALSGLNLIKGLTADILCVAIAAFICNIILKKILKIVE